MSIVACMDERSLRLMGTGEIRNLLKVSRQRTQQIISQPDFPKPAADLVGGKIWRAVDVEAWIVAKRPWIPLPVHDTTSSGRCEHPRPSEASAMPRRP